jgi:hypothetical protein
VDDKEQVIILNMLRDIAETVKALDKLLIDVKLEISEFRLLEKKIQELEKHLEAYIQGTSAFPSRLAYVENAIQQINALEKSRQEDSKAVRREFCGQVVQIATTLLISLLGVGLTTTVLNETLPISDESRHILPPAD